MRTSLGFFLLGLLLVFVPGSSAAPLRFRGVTAERTIAANSDIPVLGEWKANLVVYQLTWQGAADSANEKAYGDWLNQALNELDKKLPIFEQYRIKVVIDLFTPPGGFIRYATPAVHRIFSEGWAQRALVKTWRTIAKRYVGNPTVMGYNLVNEPSEPVVLSGVKNWSDLALEVAQAIRSIDSEHTIMVQPSYGDPAKLKRLKPLSLDGIMYNVHVYYPWSFVHQGLYGVRMGIRYPTKNLNKNSVRRNLQPIARYQRKNKVRIHIGEFSVARWAPGKSGYNYLRDLIGLIEKRGWHWSYHTFRGADVWSVEHDSKPAHLDPSPTPTDRQILLRAYFNLNRSD